jgi:hypothetical protein
MAGAACKVVINQGVRALSEALEEILSNPTILAGRLSQEDAEGLLDRLVRLDLACVDGQQQPDDSLLDILAVLVGKGIVTDEVWRLYANPESVPVPQNGDGPKPEKPKKDKDRDKGKGRGADEGRSLGMGSGFIDG